MLSRSLRAADHGRPTSQERVEEGRLTGFDGTRDREATAGAAGSGRAGRWAAGSISVLAVLIAFRGLFLGTLGTTRPQAFEYWFFLPTRESGVVSLLVVGWLLWNRRGALARLSPPSWTSRPLAAGLIGVGLLVVGLHGWALASGVPGLLTLSLCVLLATLGGVLGGAAGLRLVALPCLGLLVAMPPPNPLLSEIVWQLQRITAIGTATLVEWSGFPVVLEGNEIRRNGHAFLVIEACSGWRGIQILSIVGVAAAELRGLALSRALIVVAMAWPIGIALNIVRACLVVLTRETLDPDLFASHTPQGIAVLLIGSGLLYAVASMLATRSALGAPTSTPTPTPTPTSDLESADGDGRAPSRRLGRHRAMRFAVAVPVLMTVVSVALPGLGLIRSAPVRQPLELPLERGPWSGTSLSIDYFFPYDSALHAQSRIEYRAELGQSGLHLVDLFVARELPVGSGLNRIPETKLLRPASDWDIERREPTRIWELGVDGEQAILSRKEGAERVLVLAWRLRDEGLLVETLASAIGLDVCKGMDLPCSRVVVRIAVPIVREGSRGVDRAMQSARRFIRDFVEPLDSL